MKIMKFELEGYAPMTPEDFARAVKNEIEVALHEDGETFCVQSEAFPGCDGEDFCDEYDSCRPYKVIVEVHDAN